MHLKQLVFGIVSRATGIPLENVNEDTKIPADKIKAVFNELALSHSFCIQYTGNYTAGQILKAAGVET